MTRMTDVFVRNLKPTDKTAYYKDEDIREFGLRVTKNGVKAFTVLLGAGNRRTIGRYPQISLQDARKEAKQLLAEHTLGKTQRPRTPHSGSLQAYLSACTRKNRPATVSEYRRLLNLFAARYLDDFTPTAILRTLNTLNDRPSEKHHAFTALRAYLRWCRSEHLIDVYPMDGMRTPPTSPPRDRVLSNSELARLYHAPQIDSYSRLVHFLILYGQRRTESAMLQWDWIEQDTIRIPSHATKNKRSHHIPLLHTFTPNNRPLLFPSKTGGALKGWSKLKPAFDKRNNITFSYTLHDIRRSVATKLAQLGTPVHVIERLLNHVSGSFAGVAGTYNRFSYMEEMRASLLRWHDFLTTLPPPEA